MGGELHKLSIPFLEILAIIVPPSGRHATQRYPHGTAQNMPRRVAEKTLKTYIQNTKFRRTEIRLRSLSMLWTIAVVLLILWLLGLISGYMISGFIHILLVVAIVVVLIRIIQGRRPL